jgi:metal transporter CNNM
MGLVSQELLDLKIKEIAGDAKEKAQAKSVLPLIKDHHRLLVTLLLINAMANEALPLFLDKIVPGYIAVILSVTLVLFFGEIIPSAIFSGPNKLAIASKLAPLVQFLLWLLCPLAFPIAKVLDKVLHEEGEGDSSMEKYDRAELSALVRLQYEERKQQQNLKSKLANFDSSSTPGQPHNTGSVRFVKHIDTVNMVEGALEMQSKIAADVMIPIDNVFSISKDLSLNEDNILEIYRSGFSRVPVHEPSDKARILGVFRTRQLIVMNPDEGRDLATLPLIKPHCVGPQTNMLNLINILQTGSTANKGGHLAIVCEDSALANLSLENDECIPSDAGVLGVVTLENCIEALIKEDIYDEYDQAEKQSLERARWAADKWIKFAKKRKQEKILLATQSANNEDADESTNLLHSPDDTIYDPTQFQFQEYLA